MGAGKSDVVVVGPGKIKKPINVNFTFDFMRDPMGVLEKMYQNMEFYKGETSQEYVVNGSIIGCNYGCNLTKIGIIKDHAIYDNNENAVLTCGDCLPNENVYNFGLCGSPILDKNSEKAIVELGVPYAPGQKKIGYKCKLQLSPQWQTGKVHTHIWNAKTKQYEPVLPKDGVLTCAYGAGTITIKEVNKTPNSDGIDYFVIIKRGTVNIRETNSSSSKSLKELGPSEAIKVVAPINEVNNEEITWIEVYADKELKKRGWIAKKYIYPDETIVTEYLNHPSINFRKVTGTFNGESKTLDYIARWGLAGGGEYGDGKPTKNGKLLVAVPPKVLYPDYPDDGGLENDDFNAFDKNITVHLRHKATQTVFDLACYVKDIKAHSYDKYPDGHNNTVLPKETTGKISGILNGLIQTGIAYPKSSNAKKSEACNISHMDGSIVEFCGGEVTDFNCSDYELVSISSNETRHTYKY